MSGFMIVSVPDEDSFGNENVCYKSATSLMLTATPLLLGLVSAVMI